MVTTTIYISRVYHLLLSVLRHYLMVLDEIGDIYIHSLYENELDYMLKRLLTENG